MQYSNIISVIPNANDNTIIRHEQPSLSLLASHISEQGRIYSTESLIDLFGMSISMNVSLGARFRSDRGVLNEY